MHGSATVQPSSHSISAPVCPLTLSLFLQRKGLTSEDAESETLMVITNGSSPSRPTTTRYTLGGWPGFRLAARHGRAGATSICEQLARVQDRIGACLGRASKGRQGVWDASVRHPPDRTHARANKLPGSTTSAPPIRDRLLHSMHATRWWRASTAAAKTKGRPRRHEAMIGAVDGGLCRQSILGSGQNSPGRR